MIRRYEIAGVGFRVETDREYASVFPFDRFLTDATASSDYIYRFQKAERLPLQEGPQIFRNSYMAVYGNAAVQQRYFFSGDGPAYACAVFDEASPQISVLYTDDAPEMTESLVITVLALERQLLRKGILILHASYIDHWGQAILFTAPSGTGKSTQAELWRKYRGAEVINGDRVCITREGDRLMAHSLPIAGTSGICRNRSLPVRAIVSLEQAGENRLAELRGTRAFAKIAGGIWANVFCREDAEQMMELIAGMLPACRVFHLACLPDERAVELLEQNLR